MCIQVQVCVQAPLDILLCGGQRITLSVIPHALSPSFSETVYLSPGASCLGEAKLTSEPRHSSVTYLRSSCLHEHELAT